MYESRYTRPISLKKFYRRVFNHFVVSIMLILVSLFLGMLGYHFFENLSWIDSFINASMILGGMGPLENPQTDEGKIFAGIYALYSGLVFLVAVGVIFAPVFHRMFHLFHWKEEK
ncbi:MAG: hypothetical protein N3F03_08505 [Ignavibacteria bacterium]|nr:hypothetical protein [Ignavibacteria bacterium]